MHSKYRILHPPSRSLHPLLETERQAMELRICMSHSCVTQQLDPHAATDTQDELLPVARCKMQGARCKVQDARCIVHVETHLSVRSRMHRYSPSGLLFGRMSRRTITQERKCGSHRVCMARAASFTVMRRKQENASSVKRAARSCVHSTGKCYAKQSCRHGPFVSSKRLFVRYTESKMCAIDA